MKFIGRANVDKNAKLEWPVELKGCRIERNVEVGRYTYARQGTYICQGARIGRYCSIARGVEIGPLEHPIEFMSTHPFQVTSVFFNSVEGYGDVEHKEFAQRDGVIIGNDVWIGAKAVIRRGVKIGTGAIIGACAFVNRDVEPYAIVGGQPAKEIRKRFSPDIIERLLASEWWNYQPAQLSGIDFSDAERAVEQLEQMISEQDESG